MFECQSSSVKNEATSSSFAHEISKLDTVAVNSK